MYSLNFPIYGIAVLANSRQVVYYIPSTYLSYNWKFLFFDDLIPFPPPPRFNFK